MPCKSTRICSFAEDTREPGTSQINTPSTFPSIRVDTFISTSNFRIMEKYTWKAVIKDKICLCQIKLPGFNPGSPCHLWISGFDTFELGQVGLVDGEQLIDHGADFRQG